MVYTALSGSDAIVFEVLFLEWKWIRGRGTGDIYFQTYNTSVILSFFLSRNQHKQKDCPHREATVTMVWSSFVERGLLYRVNNYYNYS